ncbi:hypothetical protein, partial [Kosakonia sp. S42]|uniref:hypothetical protein n=1 Tax=Kosakonia sp. S42 TaxID=2767458 RepID=UPI001F3FD281
SDLTHSDLLRGHNQYAGRSLKVNGSFKRDTYIQVTTSLQRSGGPLFKSAGGLIFGGRLWGFMSETQSRFFSVASKLFKLNALG